MGRVSRPNAVTSCLFSALALAAGCGGDSEPGGDRDAGDVPDAAVDLTPVLAVPGARCAASERVGLVEVTAEGFARAHMFDRSDPWITEPVHADGSCAFHSFAVQQCDGCADDEICGIDARCTAIPRRALDGRLVLRSGADEQVFEAEPTTGELGGDITLPADSFAVEVLAFGQRVTLEPETSVPDPLPSFSASLVGTYDAPEGIEATWDPAPEGSHLFTRIPINHHAAGPTFTECAADGSLGMLGIGQPMLEPLAVATGLEFQSFEHVRFAAAETSRGCVELRFTQRQSVGLEGI